MKLNLGCGMKKKEGYINIDKSPLCSPDLLIDVSVVGLPYEDNSVQEIIASNFLEHIIPDKVIFVIEEIYRVLIPNGRFEHITPSTDGRAAFQDPTHRSFWNINSWIYYTNKEWADNYGIKALFEGENIDTPRCNLGTIFTRGVLYAVK